MSAQQRLSAADYREIVAQKKPRNKFHAVRTTSDFGTFDSKGEHDRYASLVMMEKAGVIRKLERQKRFPLFCGDQPLMIESRTGRLRQAVYVADYTYEIVETGVFTIDDFKGVDTKASQLKRGILAVMMPSAKIIVTRRPQKTRSRTVK